MAGELWEGEGEPALPGVEERGDVGGQVPCAAPVCPTAAADPASRRSVDSRPRWGEHARRNHQVKQTARCPVCSVQCGMSVGCKNQVLQCEVCSLVGIECNV